MAGGRPPCWCGKRSDTDCVLSSPAARFMLRSARLHTASLHTATQSTATQSTASRSTASRSTASRSTASRSAATLHTSMLHRAGLHPPLVCWVSGRRFCRFPSGSQSAHSKGGRGLLHLRSLPRSDVSQMGVHLHHHCTLSYHTPSTPHPSSLCLCPS